MSVSRFDWTAVVARGLFSLFVVFAIYNPTGFSYIHWVMQGFADFWAKVATGALLLLVLSMLWRTARGVLKTRGMVLVLVFCLGAGFTLAPLAGAALLELRSLVIWLLLSLAALFTAALSYSPLHHRLGGISHTEEIGQ